MSNMGITIKSVSCTEHDSNQKLKKTNTILLHTSQYQISFAISKCGHIILYVLYHIMNYFLQLLFIITFSFIDKIFLLIPKIVFNG